MRHRWTAREVLRFFEMLAEFERTVARSHVGYPRSEAYPGCHRAYMEMYGLSVVS